MIAAAWSRRGADDAARTLLQIGRAAQASAGTPLVGECAALMAWGDPPAGTLDLERAAVWIGNPPCGPSGGRGDFALARLTGDCLVLSRGLFGGRPLYYHVDVAAERIVACSRLAPLLVTRSPRASLNVEELTSLVAFGVSGDHSRTAYDGVLRVTAGQTLQVRDGRLVQVAKTRISPKPLLRASPTDYVAELRSQVEYAVRRATSGTQRIAVMFSGGLDSSVILVALIAQERGASRREIDVMTLDFDAPSGDRAYVRRLVDDLGIVPLKISPAECALLAGDALVIDGAPCVLPSAGAMATLTLAASRAGADVVLCGSGGDELLDGDLRVFAARARRGDLAGAIAWAARMRSIYWRPSAYRRIEHLVIRPMIRQLLPGSLQLWRSMRRGAPELPPWAGPRLRDFLRNPPESDFPPADSPCPTSQARVQSLANSEMLLDLADMRGQWEVYGGCQRQDVFLDQSLAEFVAAVPAELLLHGDRMRGLLRAAFADLLPDLVRFRESKGQFEPLFATHLAEISRTGVVDSLSQMSLLGELGIIIPAEYKKAMSRLQDDPMNGGLYPRLWPALAVEAFARDQSNPR